MKRLLAWLWLLLALPLWAQSPSPAPTSPPGYPDRPITHILLLDVSGSLRTRGYARLDKHTYRSHWTEPYLTLLDHLLTPDDGCFRPSDRFVVQSFSDPGTEAKEKNPVVGPLALTELVGKAPGFPAPGGGATWMVHGLDLDRQLVDRYKSDSGAVITWLFTDNENNWHGSKDDRGFYQALRDDPGYRDVYFLPIADPQRPGDSLVLYMLVHNTGPQPLWVDSLVSDVERRMGAEAILYRPLYSGGQGALEIDPNVTYQDPRQADATPLDLEGNTLVLHLNDGDSLDGQLAVRLKSTLKGWKINQAAVSGDSNLTVPAAFGDLPDALKVAWHFSPDTLTVEPLSETSPFHLSADSPPHFERTFSDLLSNPGADVLPDIEGHLTVTATIDLRKSQIQALQDPKVKERLHFVHDLDKIADYMSYQADQHGGSKGAMRTLTVERPLVIRVEAGSVGRVLLMGGGLLLLVLAVVVGLALFAWKSHYTLEGPMGPEPVIMPWLSGMRLLMEPSGVVVGKLLQRFGGLSIRPEPGVSVNGEARVTPLAMSGGEVRFETKQEQDKPQQWVLTRKTAADGHQGSDGPTL